MPDTKTAVPIGRTPFLGENPRPAKMFLDTGIEQVAGHVSQEGHWGWDGACLETVSAIAHDPLEADINLYRYCGNNPVIYVDPSGLAPAAVENIAGLALLGLWAMRGSRLAMLGPMAIPTNNLEKAAWNLVGVPVPGLTYTVKTNAHVVRAVEAETRRIQTILAAQAVGNYADEGSMSILFAPESTAMEWIFSTSTLNYSYEASVSLDNSGRKCHQGTITWKFYDEIDANSFSETYHKGGFGKDVPLITKIINFIEGEFDIGYDKLAGANYDVNLTWKTDVGGP